MEIERLCAEMPTLSISLADVVVFMRLQALNAREWLLEDALTVALKEVDRTCFREIRGEWSTRFSAFLRLVRGDRR